MAKSSVFYFFTQCNGREEHLIGVKAKLNFVQIVPPEPGAKATISNSKSSLRFPCRKGAKGGLG